MPAQGRDPEALITEMAGFREHDVAWREGRTWSLVYPAGEAHEAVLKRAASLFLSENGLNPLAFQSLKRMERDVVGMTADLLHGPASAVGTLTSGGTESLLLAVKAARDRANRRRPEIVLPETAHPAFDKAAHYFGVKLRLAKVGPDFRADPRAMARLIGRNTVLVVGSAPQYPHGVVDPIPELAELAARRGVPFHVDACFGGFLLPFLERLGHPVPPWDFRVPGVTSISADVHKYGYAPKGASVLLYRDMDHMKHQFFVTTRWSGGIYASATMPGSRPGACIAGAWASMMALGEAGYLALAEQALDTAKRLRAGLEGLDGIEVLGAGDATIVPWTTTDVDLYAVADQLAAKGWSVDRQQRPACIHCTVNASNAPQIDAYLADVRDAVAHVRAHPELATEGEAAMYGLAARVPVRGLAEPAVRQALEQLYGTEGELDEGAPPAARKLLGWLHEAERVVKRFRGSPA